MTDSGSRRCILARDNVKLIREELEKCATNLQVLHSEDFQKRIGFKIVELMLLMSYTETHVLIDTEPSPKKEDVGHNGRSPTWPAS